MGDVLFWDFDGDGELNEVEASMMWEDIDEEINEKRNGDIIFDEDDVDVEEG